MEKGCQRNTKEEKIGEIVLFSYVFEGIFEVALSCSQQGPNCS
jgi:hypothetical protein